MADLGALSTVLFGRYARVVIDTIEIVSRGIEDQSGLRFDFSVQRSLKSTANKAAVNIYNLNRDHRNQIASIDPRSGRGQSVPVSIDVGYDGGHEQIFLGFLRSALPTRENDGSVVTHIASADGEDKIRRSRVAAPVAKGTPADQVLRTVAAAVGVDQGNLNDAVTKLKGVANAFPSGTVLYGNAARELTGICRSLGLEWSVQHGKLQLLSLGAVLKDTAIRLTPQTGMLGPPSLDSKGVLSVKSLLAPGFYPGRLLVLESEFLTGQFRIEETTHSGDTRAESWYVDIKASRY